MAEHLVVPLWREGWEWREPCRSILITPERILREQRSLRGDEQFWTDNEDWLGLPVNVEINVRDRDKSAAEDVYHRRVDADLTWRELIEDGTSTSAGRRTRLVQGRSLQPGGVCGYVLGIDCLVFGEEPVYTSDRDEVLVTLLVLRGDARPSHPHNTLHRGEAADAILRLVADHIEAETGGLPSVLSNLDRGQYVRISRTTERRTTIDW